MKTHYILNLYDYYGEFSHAPRYDSPEYTREQVVDIGRGWLDKGGRSALLATWEDGKQVSEVSIDRQ